MTDIAAPCAPPAGTKSGTWHWLDLHTERHVIRCAVRWTVDCRVGENPDEFWDTADGATPEQAAAHGYRYHSPVPEPEEVEALRKVFRTIEHERTTNRVPGWVQEVCLWTKLWTRQVRGSDLGRYETNELTPLGRRALGVEG